MFRFDILQATSWLHTLSREMFPSLQQSAGPLLKHPRPILSSWRVLCSDGPDDPATRLQHDPGLPRPCLQEFPELFKAAQTFQLTDFLGRPFGSVPWRGLQVASLDICHSGQPTI